MLREQIKTLRSTNLIKNSSFNRVASMLELRADRKGTRPDSQDEVLVQLSQHQQAYWHWELVGDRRSIGKDGNVARR